MNVSPFQEWDYVVDREATIAAYRDAQGGSATCECIWCQNFVLARAQVFPPIFLDLLNSLGIDETKDAEVCYATRTSHVHHHYYGWFHFVGTINKPGSEIDLGNGFSASLVSGESPRVDAFRKLRAVELHFQARSVPWLLDEPEV